MQVVPFPVDTYLDKVVFCGITRTRMAPAGTSLDAPPPPLSSRPDDSAEGMKRRLARLAHDFGSVNALAKAAHIPQGTIRGYFERGEVPSRALLTLAQSAGVRAEWLLTGNEPMWATEPPEERRERPAADDVAFIPLYRVRASAGPGTVVEEAVEVEDYLPFKRSWLRRHVAADPEDLALLYVQGDSMEPLLRTDDMILINRAQARVREGVYALTRGEELLVKRLQPGLRGRLSIVSENKAYPPIEVAASEIGERIKIVGRVVWASRRLP